MSSIEAVEDAASTAAAAARRRLPVTAANAASAGPPRTGAISIGLVSSLRKIPVRATRSGIPGWKISPAWAASWCATSTTVRPASGSPSSQTTLLASFFGSTRRTGRSCGGKSRAIAARPARPSAPPRSRWPRPIGRDLLNPGRGAPLAPAFDVPAISVSAPASPAAVPIASGHQYVP